MTTTRPVPGLARRPAPGAWYRPSRRGIIVPAQARAGRRAPTRAIVRPSGLGAGLPWQLAEPLGKPAYPGYYLDALAILRPPVWCNWLFDQHDIIWPRYLPMLWAMLYNDACRQALTISHYGPRLWLVGNEPERPDQSNTTPIEAASVSRLWADQAGGEWAGPGILLGLQAAYDWLDAYLVAGGAIPDAWAVHIYAWTVDHWRGMLSDFVAWVAARQIYRPIFVTETASWSTDLPMQFAIMDCVRQAIDAGDIEAGLWYMSTAWQPEWEQTALLDDDLAMTLTALGRHYLGLGPGPVPGLDIQAHLPIVVA